MVTRNPLLATPAVTKQPICRGNGSSGSYPIPASVLGALPPSASAEGIPTGVIGVGTINYNTFTASGIDQGIMSQVDMDLTTVDSQ